MEPTARRRVPLRAASKATKAETRLANLRLTLQVVMAAGSTSRADIARQTGLTRATVSALVADLIADDLLVETGLGESAGGKPPTLLEINGSARQVIALDLSSAPLRGALLDLAGETVLSTTGPDADLQGPDAVDAVVDLVTDLAARATAPLLGVGVGTPGVVDDRGHVVEAANLGWHDLPLGELLAERTGLAVHVANDAQVSAIDEYGRREDVDSLVVVRVGRGIGAGIVLDGRPHAGDRHAAGEIGHLRVVDDARAPECRCGRRGCLELYASLPAIMATTGRAGGDPAQLDDSDAGALAIAADHLGAALANLVAVLDVSHVVLGGPVEQLGAAFLDAVREALSGRILPAVADTLALTYSTAGPDAVLAGAWALVLAEELGVVRR
ncbi:ROK family protein [Euzebya sp.]|uniref:ROK family protein n=1 Tax=Euzebya sp. TaxID=1971409 RepID=UPI003511D700